MISNRVIATVLAGLVVCSLAVTPVAAADPPEPSLVIDLDETGDAQVTLTTTYDLDSEEEAAAFESLQSDEERRAEILDQFAVDLQSVADAASERTERPMVVTGEDVTTERQDDVGVLRVTVHWTDLAAIEGDRLVVTEPFASGYETDRSLSIVVPDGFTVADATPMPDDEGDGTATWAAGTALDGFQVSMEAPDGEIEAGAADATDDSLPGFGVVSAALAALVGATLVARRSN
jgi:PGF-CTERM protein